jgi:hypothetical protein
LEVFALHDERRNTDADADATFDGVDISMKDLEKVVV